MPDPKKQWNVTSEEPIEKKQWNVVSEEPLKKKDEISEPSSEDVSLTESPLQKLAKSTKAVEVASDTLPIDLFRADGTRKGSGFLGELQRPDGKVSTELSIGVDWGEGEKNIPTLVPTLNETEKKYLLNTPEKDLFTANPTLFKSIENKAVDHAKKRIAEGKNVFAENEDTIKAKGISYGLPETVTPYEIPESVGRRTYVKSKDNKEIKSFYYNPLSEEKLSYEKPQKLPDTPEGEEAKVKLDFVTGEMNKKIGGDGKLYGDLYKQYQSDIYIDDPERGKYDFEKINSGTMSETAKFGVFNKALSKESQSISLDEDVAKSRRWDKIYKDIVSGVIKPEEVKTNSEYSDVLAFYTDINERKTELSDAAKQLFLDYPTELNKMKKQENLNTYMNVLGEGNVTLDNAKLLKDSEAQLQSLGVNTKTEPLTEPFQFLWNKVVDTGMNLLSAGKGVKDVVDVNILGQKGYTESDLLMDKATEFADEYLKFTLAQRPVINEKGGVNYHNLAPSIINTGIDMALLLAPGEMIAAPLKAMGVASKTASGAGLIASSMLQTYGDYYNTAMETGLNKKDATNFAVAQSAVTSLLEMVSPQKGWTKILTSKPIAKELSKDMVKYLSTGKVFKKLIESSVRAGKETTKEIGQEFSQLFSEKMINGITNMMVASENGASLDSEVSKAEAKETAILTATTALLFHLPLGGVDIEQRNEIMSLISTDYAKFKEISADMVEKGEVTQDQVDAISSEAETWAKAMSKIPKTISEEKKRELIPLLNEKETLKKEQSEVDEAFKPEYDPKIAAVDEKIAEAIKPKEEIKSEDQPEALKDVESTAKALESATYDPVKFEDAGDGQFVITGGNLKIKEIAKQSDKKESVKLPSKIPFLPKIINLVHLSRNSKDKKSILKNGFNPKETSIESPIPGVYFSSEDWSTMDRFGRDSGDKIYTSIENDGLIYFDNTDDFTNYLKENNLPYRGETLSDAQLQVLKDKGVKAILLREDFASRSRNELIVIDDSIIKSVSENETEITKLPESFNNKKSIAEAYHKAKADGSNPELVKAVEDLLQTKQKEKAVEQPKVEIVDYVPESSDDIIVNISANPTESEVQLTEEAGTTTGIETGTEVRLETKEKTETGKVISETIPRDIVGEYKVFKTSLEVSPEFKAGEKAGKRDIKESQSKFVDWIKENTPRINEVNANLKTSLLKKVSNITNEKTLQKAIDYTEKALQKKEYVNDVSQANSDKIFIKKKAKIKGGKNIFGDKYDVVQDMLRINPEDLSIEDLAVYKSYSEQAVKALKENSRVPDIKPIEQILESFRNQIEVIDEELRKADSFEKINKAFDKLEDIESVKSVSDYRTILSKVGQIESQALILYGERKITEQEYSDIIKKLDDIYTKSEESSLEEQAQEFKKDIIKEAKSKKVQIQDYSLQKEKAIRDFLNIPEKVLEEMPIKDVDSYNRLIDALNDGLVGSEMYTITTKAKRTETAQKLTDYLTKAESSDRFKKLKKKSDRDIRQVIETLKTYRIDISALGSISKGLYEDFYFPMDDAILKIETTEGNILKDYVKSLKSVKSGMTNSKFEILNKKIGLLLNEMDWRSNKIRDPKTNKEYTWDNAPNDLKSKIDYVLENNKDKIKSGDEDMIKDSEIWQEIKSKYTENGIVNIEKALNDLKKNPKISKYIEDYQGALGEVKPYVEVATENRGKYFESRDNYHPSIVKERTYKTTPALYENIDNVTGKMKGSRLSVEAGSTNTRTNKPYFTESDISKIIFKTTKDALTDYYLTPAMKSSMGGLRDAGKKTGNAGIAEAINNDVMNRIKNNLNKKEIENSEKIFKRLLKYTKYMSLAKFDRIPREYLANSMRAFIAEGVTPADYKYANKTAYREILKEGVSDEKLSQYQEEIESTQKFNESKMTKATRGIITFSDTQIGRLLFAKKFNQTFKEKTGNDFDSNKYETDVDYRIENKDNIQKSKTAALSRIEELFNSKRPLSSPTKVKFFGKNLEKGKTVTDLLYYMQSFNHNEFEQIKDSIYKINKGNPRERSQGYRDIASILISNFMYVQSTLLINELYSALATDLIDDDEENEVKNALTKYYNENLYYKKLIPSLVSSLINLVTGKNNNVAKGIVSPALDFVNMIGKEYGIKNEEWFIESNKKLQELASKTYYAKPIGQYGRTDAALVALVPGIGELYGVFRDMGYDIIKISSKSKSEIKDNTEEYIWNLSNTVNTLISLIVPNPFSPTAKKFSGKMLRAIKNEEKKPKESAWE